MITKEEFNFLSQYYMFEIYFKKHTNRLALNKSIKKEFIKKDKKINMHKNGIHSDVYYDHFFYFLHLEEKQKLKKINLQCCDIKTRWQIIENFLSTSKEILDIIQKDKENYFEKHKRKNDNIRGKKASLNLKHALNTEEYKNKRSNITKKQWNDPEYRAFMLSDKAKQKRLNGLKAFNIRADENLNGPEAKIRHKIALNPERRKKISQAHKNRIAKIKNTIKYQESLKKWANGNKNKKYLIQGKPANKIEFLISQILDELKIKYIFEYAIVTKSSNIYFADFLILENIILEAMGDFWHASDRILKKLNLNLNDIIFEGKTVEQIRKSDQLRKKI